MPTDDNHRELSFDDIRPSFDRLYVSPRSGNTTHTPEWWASYFADAMEAALSQPLVHPRDRQPFDWNAFFLNHPPG
jgi:hypothetical protein